MELLSFFEYPEEDFPYSLVLNNQKDGNYIFHAYSLSAYISNLNFTGHYRELNTFLTTYVFTEKTDAMQIKLGWDPYQDSLNVVSGSGW